MNEERWIEVSLESYEMSRRLREAIYVSYQVHTWAMGVLRDHWIETMQVLTINEMQPMMTYWLREQGLEAKAQRYSLDASLSQTAIYFNNGLRVADTSRREHNPSISVLVTEAAPEKDLRNPGSPNLAQIPGGLWETYDGLRHTLPGRRVAGRNARLCRGPGRAPRASSGSLAEHYPPGVSDLG